MGVKQNYLDAIKRLPADKKSFIRKMSNASSYVAASCFGLSLAMLLLSLFSTSLGLSFFWTFMAVFNYANLKFMNLVVEAANEGSAQ
jgi:hypothetical protein